MPVLLAEAGGRRRRHPDRPGNAPPLNGAENAKLARLYGDGTISQATRQRLRRGLDMEAARLSDEQH
jgi:hypothetical protein